MKAPRSLVLITIDCLRADHVGFLGYSPPATPFLDSLARDSTIFTNAIAAGSPTYYSFPAIMASRYPLATGRDLIGLGPEEQSLASTLSQSGYATAAFLAANPYLSGRFGYQAGFDTFHDYSHAEPKGEALKDASNQPEPSRANAMLAEFCHRCGPLGYLYDELYFQYCQRRAEPKPSWDALRRFPSADVIVGNAITWLKTIERNPFFLWLHLMDPHAPYYPSADALDAMGNGRITAKRGRYLNSYWQRGDLSVRRLAPYAGEVMALYDAGIRWADTQLARLVMRLRENNMWDHCVFAVTADHGEEFLEHGGRSHPPSKLTNELIRVPLLLSNVEGKLPPVMKNPFSLIHLAPTLLESIGIPVPGSFRGRAWSQQASSEEFTYAVTESVAQCTNPFRAAGRVGSRILSVQDSHYKLVMDFAAHEDMLFDLTNDPKELKPLPRLEQRAVRQRLLMIAGKHIQQSHADRDPVQRLQAKLHNMRLELSATGA